MHRTRTPPRRARTRAAVARDAELSQQVLEADVCVVGAGPAGLTVAAELRGSGAQVLVLEAGRAVPPPGGDAYRGSQSVGRPYAPDTSRARGVGGTALRWMLDTPLGGAHLRLRELDELDLEDRPGVRVGWPVGAAVLAPYYRRARSLMDLGDAEPAEVVEGGLERRVFSFARASTFTHDLPARLAEDPDTRVLADATVTALETAVPGGPVTAAAVVVGGRRLRVRARVFVLAGGGIENARLLLVSRGTSPAGLGNAHDLVGRYFMEHPDYTAAAVVPPDHGLQQRRADWAVVERAGRAVQVKYGLSAQRRREEGLLDVTCFLEPRPVAWALPMTPAGDLDAEGLEAARHLRHRAAGPFGEQLRRAGRAAPLLAAYALRQQQALRGLRTGHPGPHPAVLSLTAMAEQEPCRDSTVRLGSGVDRLGVPVVAVDWRTTERDEASLRRTQQLLGPALARRLGVRVVDLLPGPGDLRLGWGFHHMGTTRMAVSAADGVVDRDCRLHEAPNLFVAGSSVFPAGGSANPTLTLVALAIRLADRLRNELAPQHLRGGAAAPSATAP